MAEKKEKTSTEKYIDLIESIRKSKKKSKIDQAFNEIVSMLDPKIKQIVYQFNIAGHDSNDIYQESLCALRYKAIKDYDQTRGSGEGPYPFDRFAILCIRRHLSTIRKASYQNKKRALNFSVSLDQDRNNIPGGGSGSLDEFISLSEIYPQTEGTILDTVERKEYYKYFFEELFPKLSSFEKEVFVLYLKKHSYEQITKIINKRNVKAGIKRITVKSIDNSIMRIKGKTRKIRDIIMQEAEDREKQVKEKQIKDRK